jgi:methyl-accepting chemotaxis protein
MKIRTKLLLILFISFIPSFLIGIIFIYQTNKITSFVKNDIPKNLSTIATASHLEGLSFIIRYYDEVLTQSARNYALTGDIKWKNRYDENVPKLDAAIKQAIAEGDENDRLLFKKVGVSNLNLIEMETQAMALTKKNNKTEAIAILESKKYSDNKKIYSNALVQFAENKGVNYNQTVSFSTQNIAKQIQFSDIFTDVNIATVAFFIIFLLASTFFFSFYISSKISSPIVKLKNVAEEISEGKKPEAIIISSDDEIGELTKAFQKMVFEIEKSKEEIEKKVEERTSNLNQLNKLMVNRELKMVELKKELAKFQNEN